MKYTYYNIDAHNGEKGYRESLEDREHFITFKGEPKKIVDNGAFLNVTLTRVFKGDETPLLYKFFYTAKVIEKEIDELKED